MRRCMMVTSIGKTFQIVVVDDNGSRDLGAIRPVWEGMNVELLGPFPAQALPGDILRQANGVLISLGIECQRLERLMDRLEATQVPFLFIVDGGSYCRFTLESCSVDIEEMLERLAIQGDNGLRH